MTVKTKPAAKPVAEGIKQTPELDLPTGENREIDPQDLLFDTGNLRLLERGRQLLGTPAIDGGQPAVQKKVEQALRDTSSFDVQGLAVSIANNTFLKHERLIVASYDGEKFLVLEGNRRLAAVRYIREKVGFAQLSPEARKSIETLPCFVLAGLPVVDRALEDGAAKEAEKRLRKYRKAAAVYIGLRHLMGSKGWEPASRYEFQAQLILEEGWTLQQVASRFGRKLPAVRRDLQAHVLYRDFLKWEKEMGRQHRVTYNAFSEAARAKSIKEWLGWSDDDNQITNKERESVFFRYLSSRFPVLDAETGTESDDIETPSVERALRQLKCMLDLQDSDIEEALEAGEFDSAENLFETRKDGKFAKRVKGYVRGLKNATSSELQDGAQENKDRLTELVKTAQSVLAQLEGFLKG